MYLATSRRGADQRFEIRQSRPAAEHTEPGYRVIFELGARPDKYIICPSEDICYFDERLEECVSQYADRDASLILEELLYDFLPESEKHRLSYFSQRGKASITPLSARDTSRLKTDIHLFDQRRLYYLRYGAVDQSRIFRLNPKLYRPLLDKCRDEREFYFMNMEKVLQEHEMRTYVFAIFDLQRHFSQSFSATMPEALNQIDIADYFLEDVCTLNADDDFWADLGMSDSLHEHLIRYVVMFFDYGYGRRSLFDDFLREFMGRHRNFSWPEKKPSVSTSQAAEIFNEEWQTLQKMSKKELGRLYRQRAKELHPDSGGDHEQFIQLKAAYGSLLLRKR
jgi:hypothetical protein